ncbi:MAG TPA: hypothetical protein VF407_14805 [Polyangiaceae bacterium]
MRSSIVRKHASKSTVLGAIALGGCSLFVSTSDLQSGDGDASPNDDAAFDSSTSDVVLDAAKSDTGSVDAGVDACTFCDDFDDRTSVQGSWGSVNGNVDISTTVYRSAPHSAHFHTDAVSSGYASATLTVTIPLGAAPTSVDFDVMLATDKSGADGYVSFFQSTLVGDYAGAVTATKDTYAFDYWVNFPDGGHAQPVVASNTNVDQAWHHARYAIRYDETNGSWTVAWDGVPVTDQSKLDTFATSPSPTTVDFSFGALAAANEPAIDVYVDNVAVR